MSAFYRCVDASGYSGKRNFVLSRTLTEAASPKVSIVNDPVTAFIERLRGKKRKHFWLVGGAELIASFLDSVAVDEFIIHVNPHVIGDGIPLVSPRHRALPLKLLACRAFADGVVRLHYAVKPS
jgi:dihydrofolate reductase